MRQLPSSRHGFGRVIETDEPNASGTLSPKSCYTYDLNGNLTGVLGADGSQTRGHVYDLLSRVTSKTEPETKGNTTDSNYTYAFDAENRMISATTGSGTYCYTYDGNGLRVEKGQAQSGYTCTSTSPYAPTVNEIYWRNTGGRHHCRDRREREHHEFGLQ